MTGQGEEEDERERREQGGQEKQEDREDVAVAGRRWENAENWVEKQSRRKNKEWRRRGAGGGESLQRG